MRRQTNKNIRSILPVALLVLVTAGVTGCGGGSGGTLGGGFSGVAVSAANVAKGATLQQSLTSSQVADLQISGLPADTLVTLSLANATSQADSPITTRSNGAGVAVFPRVSFADGKKFRIQTADNAVDFFLQISVSGSAGGVVLVSVATPPVNHVPVARIGAVQNASVGAPVSLAGSQSSDPDNDALSFIWAQSSGPAQVTLTGAGTATASFTPAVAGGYSFRLTVSDGKGGIAFADVTVTVSAASSTLGSLSGKITDSKTALNPIAGVLVNIEGTSKTATTGSDGKFSFSNVPPGSVFVTATPPTGTYLPGETRDAVYVGAGAAVTGVNIVLSARQGDSATYIGLNGTNGGVGCATCHANKVASFTNSAHYRSLSSGFSRLINPILTTGPRAGKHMWPEVGEVLDSGVKANNPAYDPNDTGVPASLATTKVYLCQPITGTWAMKFGGSATTIADADRNTFPLVHIDFVYGGEGDRDSRGAKPNYGVFKQRYQGSLADCKVADLWTYTSTADKARDTLTLPVQIAQSGDTLKFAGYHPAEATFPHESWTERSRTFSHACAGCHNTGMTIDWDIQQFTYAVADPEGSKAANQAAIKTYNYIDQNITCEQCHGPGSEHADAGGGKGVSIINPAYLTAEGERQVCAKCHAFDDGQNAKPAQDYGFEFPWNSDNAAKLGGGNFIGGVYNIADYLGNRPGSSPAVPDAELLEAHQQSLQEARLYLLP
ncbi:MAG: carboxypeptidase regulatory-like domain-containing protein [Candidatus Wallbacteria bacterium]|nr:carboxypeptidase regulatory-like domain-containing protein [Candidatus Wallbacteria bacterium]